jgi:hypothetical protein
MLLWDDFTYNAHGFAMKKSCRSLLPYTKDHSSASHSWQRSLSNLEELEVIFYLTDVRFYTDMQLRACLVNQDVQCLLAAGCCDLKADSIMVQVSGIEYGSYTADSDRSSEPDISCRTSSTDRSEP